MTSNFREFPALVRAGLIAIAVAIAALSGDTVRAQPEDRRKDAEALRISDATAVLSEIVSAKEKAIPRAILEKAEGIAVFPRTARVASRRGQGPNTMRTQRLLGVTGRGILSVRGENRTWSSPAFLALTGSNLPQTADLVLVVLNRRGIEKLTGHQFAIRADGPVAPGPVGSNPGTPESAQDAEILVYSRTRGVLTGASLTGSNVQQDTIANQRFYGKRFTTRNALDQESAPAPAAAWRAALEKHAR
jgi:lipid-binding SYLF domain-containing protein